jgi:citrate lyase beta subunit
MSILFVPAIKISNIPKMSLHDDILINLDLEDSVPKELKKAALDSIFSYLETDQSRFDYTIRINSIEEGGLDEIARIRERRIQEKIVGLLIPKSNKKTVEIVKEAAGDITIIPIIETIEAVIEFDDICEISAPPMLFFGLNDIATDMQIIRPKFTGDSFLLYSIISQLVVKSKYRKIRFIVGSYIFYKDLKGFRKECVYMKELGIDMYLSIHPSQLPIAEEIFKVSSNEINWAQEVIKVYDGKGGCISNGKQMFGPPHYKLAQRIISKSQAHLNENEPTK